MKLPFFFFSSFLLSFPFGFCFLLSAGFGDGVGAIGAAEGRGEREGLKELGPGWVVWVFFFFFSLALCNILITVITVIYYDDYFYPSPLLEVFPNRL